MGLVELATAARYRLPVKVVVLNNGVLGQIKWEQMLLLGNPEFACALAPVDFARAAEAMGMKGLRTDDPDRITALLDEAFAHDGPVLVDAVVDPDEPMLPPLRREECMKHLTRAFGTGTPRQAEIERRLKEEPARTSLEP
jgi:thiamine pyrophosphate-dependent acetolactate synthase large subunit-like protein